ncbi:hypothetical protein BH09MYX1_BH09MYX1_19270 [soil metagenome]
MSFSVTLAAPRIACGRPGLLRDRAQALAYCNEFRRLIPTAKPKAIIVADYRGVAIFPPDVAEELARLMSDMNPLIERSAILVDPSHATAALQVGRVVQASHNENRRRLTSRADLETWVGEIATLAELGRIRAFLDEGDPSKA